MFKTPWNILRNNMIFIQPILLILLLLMLSSTYLIGGYSHTKLLLALSVFMATVAFISGWFHINKLGIIDYNPEDEQEEITSKTIKNFKQFFAGVGENFLKVLFATLIFMGVYFASIFLLGKVCMKIFGEPVIFIELAKIAKTVTTQSELVSFLNTVSIEDKLVFVRWMMSIIAMSSILNFIGVLYLVVIFSEKVNIFISLFKTIKFFVLNILKSILIIVFMFALYMLLNILSLVLGANAISFAILIILFVLYLNYYVLLVFCFYDEKTKNNCDYRTEFLG